MRNFTLSLLAPLLFALLGTQAVYSQEALPPIDFNTQELANAGFGDNPTSLQFGPDGRLYVAEQNGKISIFTIERDDAPAGSGTYTIVDKEVLGTVKNEVPNHNDDGAANATKERQMTGILVTGTAEAPIIYATSSDWRIGGGGSGTDLNLDTNSGVISRLTKTANGWEKVDLVRGLPRCEENHATNGLALVGSTLLVQSGGHTNKGAPSNNFSGTPEYMLSGVLLSVDLNQLESMPVYNDPRSNTAYVYDLPTLNDPSREDITNSDPRFPYPSGHPMYNATIDVGDPFGGNNSLNQAVFEPGGPVQIFAAGFRNAYDVVVTEDGHIFTSDNGPNGGWGGQPLIYTADGNLKGVQGENGVTFDPDNGDYITNEFNESSSSTHGDPLHYLGTLGSPSNNQDRYYGGHPAPIQAFPSRAQLIVYEEVGNGNWAEVERHDFATLVNGVSGYFNASLSIANFPDRQKEGEYLTGTYTSQSKGVYILDIVSSSTNGIVEYTASNFAGQLKGNILTASFNGNINSYKLAPEKTSYETKEALLNGFGSQPLDVTAQGDDDIFPGTIWAAVYGSSKVVVFEPNDFGSCLQEGEVGYDPNEDYDGDGFTNGDEIAVGTNHCSAGSVPSDFDGDFSPDGLDDDDDNDGILDVNDAFALDPENGTTTNLPIDYPFWNNDPGTGLFGIGFTGLMNNGVTDYLNQFDPDNLSPGGAAGKLGMDAITEGDALTNNQEYAFQFGVNVDANSPPFTVRSAVESPYFLVNGSETTPVDNQSQGIYIGTGDQDNYLRVVFQNGTDSGDDVYGIEVLLEDNGTVTSNTYDVVGIENTSAVEIYISVNPAAQTAQPAISLNGGQDVLVIGDPVALPASFLDPNDSKGLAVGVIATSAGPGAEFGASWDYMTISEDQPGVLAANPESIAFGDVTEGGDASEIDLELFNLGSPSDGDITISAINFTGTDAGLFSTTTTPPVSLAPGNELLLPVVFTPGVELGPKSATMSITHDGSNSPLEVPLTATVVENDIILVRINGGGVGLTASDDGPNWEANNSLTAGESYTMITDEDKFSTHNLPVTGRHSSIPDYIDDATYVEIFKNERWDKSTAPELQFQIPLPNEDYKVNLYMGNGFSGTAGAGERIFDILIEGVLVEDNLDLSGTFGHQVGAMIQYPVTVSDGELNIEFLHASADNPLINAIEIIGPPITIGPIVVDPVLDQSNQIGDVIDLAIAASGGDPQENFTYSIAGQPAGLDIETTNGHIFGTIDAAALTGGVNQDGIHDVQVTVSKPSSTPVTVSFQWTVTNVAQAWMDQTDDENYTARHECSFVQAGDKFYLFGGRENPTDLDIYDYTTKTWSTQAASAPHDFNHFQATEYQGLIWVIGAFKANGFPNEPAADFIWAYDPANDEWIQGPEIPEGRKRGSAGLVVYNDKFYIVGGNSNGHDGGYVSWFDEYDPATGQWTPLTDAPHARDHFHAALIGNKLYAAGGRLSGGPEGTFEPLIAEVDVYDFTTGTWSTLPSDQNLPTPRAAAATAVFQDELYLIGGEIQNDLDGNTIGDAVATTESYNPGTGTWTTHGDLITKRHGTQAIVSGAGIHVAAGSNTLGGSGAMKNMEYFGADNPQGSPSVAGTFEAPASVQVPIGGSATITLSNTGGNVAILLGEMVLGGTDATEFNLGAGADPVGLIPSGGTHEVTVSFTGTEAGKTATLTVNYGAASSVVIDLFSSNEPTILYRVNAGGPLELGTDTDWAEDQADGVTGTSGGTAGTGTPSPYVNSDVADQTFGGNPAGFVNNTGYPDALFHTERYSNLANPDNMQWDFPVANGEYEINLLFAERWTGATTPGVRVFDVEIEGQPALTNFDQTAAFGWNTAGVTTFHINVTDGNLDIDFIKGLQNPNLKGIEVLALNGPAANTPPVVTNPGDQTNEEGDVVNLPIIATEPEIGQTLSYSATNLPPGLSIDANTGVISGTVAAGAAANSPYAVTLTITDDGTPVESTDVNFQWTINGTGANLTLNVTLQGRDSDHSGSTTVDFYLSSDLSAPAYSFSLTADAAGDMVLPQSIAIGDYEVVVNRPGYLQHIVAMSVTGTATESLGMLLAGDINEDNLVDISDFSILASAFLLGSSDPGFEPLADYNADGLIDISDFSILAQNFLLAGDELPAN
jgi:N-acetylneuraminic acid mutarotase